MAGALVGPAWAGRGLGDLSSGGNPPAVDL